MSFQNFGNLKNQMMLPALIAKRAIGMRNLHDRCVPNVADDNQCGTLNDFASEYRTRNPANTDAIPKTSAKATQNAL